MIGAGSGDVADVGGGGSSAAGHQGLLFVYRFLCCCGLPSAALCFVCLHLLCSSWLVVASVVVMELEM